MIPPSFIIVISFAAFQWVVLFGYCVYHLQGRRRRQRGKTVKVQNARLDDLETSTSTVFSHDRDARNQERTESVPFIALKTIQAATNNFSDSNKLGEGGFRIVYKGMLPVGKVVAVKRLSRSSGQGFQEFQNEASVIAKLQHRNLVRLLFCCTDGEEKILIYEYMPNHSLDAFIFDPIRRSQLNWKSRLNIVNGIARGLLYLHEDSRLRIIHRDLKAGNILLYEEMNPKISDFGLAKRFTGNQNEASTNRVVGTYGYMAPEYAMAGLFSVKSDVFSFGVLILEIISGQRNNGLHHPEHGQSLLCYVWRLWCEGKALEFMDSLLADSCETTEVLRCIHIGLLCVQEDAVERPTMSSVVLMLGSDSATLPNPTQPAFSVGRTKNISNQLQNGSDPCSVSEVTLSIVAAR